MSAIVQPTINEIVELGAVDTEFFARTFFPRTMRQDSSLFQDQVWSVMDDPANRLVNLQIFRGGAKTSSLRIFTAKRIAYGLAHTILYIGKSEGHAVRSVKWLRRQVEYNRQFATVFNLRKGNKWQDVEAEIWHGTDEYPVWILAMGITGSVRGILEDDYRPDLIIVDDVIDEENSATVEQREKVMDLLYGAVKESLAPASEAPDAKLVMLQTPLNREDPSTLALSDPEWTSRVFGCWTPETASLPIDRQESAWPARWSSETLRKEKRAASQRNKLSLWLREKECKIVSPETSAFRPEWLNYYDLEPDDMRTVLVIDPVPPPSEAQIAKGLHGKDFEALTVVGARKGDFYLVDYALNRGHEPDWTLMTFWQLCSRWRPSRVVVEAVAYQRTLAWLLRKAMQQQGRYIMVEEYVDKRRKYQRIVDNINGPASSGHLYVKLEHTEFVQQFTEYSDVAHDDLLETVAIGIESLSMNTFGEEDEDDFLTGDDGIPELAYARGAP